MEEKLSDLKERKRKKNYRIFVIIKKQFMAKAT